jgi:hypothetical protein
MQCVTLDSNNSPVRAARLSPQLVAACSLLYVIFPCVQLLRSNRNVLEMFVCGSDSGPSSRLMAKAIPNGDRPFCCSIENSVK